VVEKIARIAFAKMFDFARVNKGPCAMWGGTLVTPIPPALPLFATGLGALGLLGWRRKKKEAALAA